MGRRPSLNWKKEVVGLKRGPWTAEEDKILTAYIQQHGHGNWRALPEKAGLQRCGKSCRLRWINYLRPDIKRGKFSLQEEQTIIQLHALLGNRWSVMAAHLPKRTDNEIKNHWNTHLKKRLIKLGVDPMTHKPRTDNATSFPSGSGKKASNLSHMAQWESARLEAEARLVRESKQVVPPNPNSVAPKNHVTRTLTTQLRPRCLDVLKAWQGVVAGMFAFSSQDLGSPTSTLSIPDGTVHQTPAIGLTTTSYTDKSSAGWGAAMKLDGQNILKCIDKKSNQMQQVEETIMDSYMDLHGVTSSSEIEAWFEDSFRVGNYANVEGLSDALTLNSDVLNSPIAVEKSTESCGGNILDHTNCWDNVLSLVNSPYDSFVLWPQCQPEFNFNGSSEI